MQQVLNRPIQNRGCLKKDRKIYNANQSHVETWWCPSLIERFKHANRQN